jgi:hypothetical protein
MFGVTVPITVPQRSEIPEGLMNNPVFHDSFFVTATAIYGSVNTACELF